MRRTFKAEDYLHLADTLAGRTARQGRPRTAYLRRATSTAYYALFHELVRHGANRAVQNGPEDHQHAIGRWYAHGNFRQVARWVENINSGRSAPTAAVRLLTTRGQVNADLVILAISFSDLQDARHGADYDPDYDATRSATLGQVNTARSAIEAIRRMDKYKLHEFDMFLLLALGGERMLRNG
ncbi:hypothetical protein [Nonomuraea cavernae]|uniref:hypothetical protein n=1 Tax=Nonomuraea cavernae TaxID=2045107 RepID=UPI0033DE0FC3